MDRVFEAYCFSLILNRRWNDEETRLLWRNWLARSAVNRKVGGSSPPRSVSFFFSLLFQLHFFHPTVLLRTKSGHGERIYVSASGTEACLNKKSRKRRSLISKIKQRPESQRGRRRAKRTRKRISCSHRFVLFHMTLIKRCCPCSTSYRRSTCRVCVWMFFFFFCLVLRSISIHNYTL